MKSCPRDALPPERASVKEICKWNSVIILIDMKDEPASTDCTCTMLCLLMATLMLWPPRVAWVARELQANDRVGGEHDACM